MRTTETYEKTQLTQSQPVIIPGQPLTTALPGQPLTIPGQPLNAISGQPLLLPGQPLTTALPGQPLTAAIPGQPLTANQEQPVYCIAYYPATQTQAAATTTTATTKKETPVTPTNAPRVPCKMYCPYCKKNVLTTIDYEYSSTTWVLCFLLFWFTCCLFFIPFLMDDLKIVIHFCPKCKREIARNQK